MLNNLDDDDNDKQTQEQVYEFVDGDNRKSFLCECPAHVLYLWHLAYKYDILHTVRQQLQVSMVMPDQVWMQPNL